jgi:hypothetical protein
MELQRAGEGLSSAKGAAVPARPLSGVPGVGAIDCKWVDCVEKLGLAMGLKY